MITNILAAIAVVSGIRSESAFCKTFSDLKQCKFLLPKTRIYRTITAAYSGTDQSECLTRMERFHWSTAIFCPLSWFCGMGMDLMRDYSWVTSGEVTPVKEMCHIWVQNDILDCDNLISAIYAAGILKSKLKRV